MERQSPDAILAVTELTGVIGDIQDDPDNPDANWLVATGNNVDTDVRVSFPTPAGSLIVGADLQEFRALVRQYDEGQTGTPQARIELWENGALIRAGPDIDVPQGGVVLSFTWNASELATADGSLVECKVVGTKTGGGPTKRNTVEVGAVEWNVTYSSNPGNPGSGMEQVIFGGYHNALHSTDTEYNSLIGGNSWLAAAYIFRVENLVSTSGKIKNLRVKLDDSPGAGKSYAFTLMVNGAPSALTLTIADTATSGVDTTHEVDLVAGDYITLQCVPTNSPTARYAYWTSMFEGATAKESLICGGTAGGFIDNTATGYSQLMGAGSSPSATENDYRQVCPTSGKIKNLYVRLNKDPGTAPDAFRFTLRKNGVSQALTVTIIANDTTGNDTVNEVTVAAGDVLTLMIEPVDTPIQNTAAGHWGMTLVADIDGESVILAGSKDDLNTGVTEYLYLVASSKAWSSSEHFNLGQSCTLKKLYMLLSAAPGDGKSYAFTLRKGDPQGDGNLTVTITGAATTGNDVAHEDSIADDDYVGLKCVPAGTPDVADAYWGVVGYVAPPPLPSYPDKTGNIANKMVGAGLI